MGSSGQYVRDVQISEACGADEPDDGCGFAGVVDATEDPETMTGQWTCPNCGTEHEYPLTRED